MAAGQANPFVNDQLKVAQALAAEKEGLSEKINANRQILRLTAQTGELSAEQASAIQEFYPPVKRTKAPAKA